MNHIVLEIFALRLIVALHNTDTNKCIWEQSAPITTIPSELVAFLDTLDLSRAEAFTIYRPMTTKLKYHRIQAMIEMFLTIKHSDVPVYDASARVGAEASAHAIQNSRERDARVHQDQ